MPLDESAYGEALQRFTALEADPGVSPRLSLRDILRAANEATGVPVDDIIGRSRKKYICVLRNEVMLLAQGEGYSLGQIGRALGGRDHTTILHGIKNAKKRQALLHFQQAAEHT